MMSSLHSYSKRFDLDAVDRSQVYTLCFKDKTHVDTNEAAARNVGSEQQNTIMAGDDVQGANILMCQGAPPFSISYDVMERLQNV